MNPYIVAAGAASLVLASVGGGVVGYKVRDSAFQKHLKKDAEQAARITAASSKITLSVATVLAARQGEIAALTQQLQNRTPLYVPAAPCVNRSDGTADVTVGFARLHDYAASGALPGAPSGPISAPSGVGMPAVSDTITRNYGVCHKWEAEVEAWREWYTRQKMVWEMTK